jgi:hypothetical protein
LVFEGDFRWVQVWIVAGGDYLRLRELMQVLRLRTSHKAATYFAQDDNVWGMWGRAKVTAVRELLAQDDNVCAR